MSSEFCELIIVYLTLSSLSQVVYDLSDYKSPLLKSDPSQKIIFRMVSHRQKQFFYRMLGVLIKTSKKNLKFFRDGWLSNRKYYFPRAQCLLKIISRELSLR